MGSPLGMISRSVAVSTTLRRFNSLCCPACELGCCSTAAEAAETAETAAIVSFVDAGSTDVEAVLATVLAVLAAFNIFFGVGVVDDGVGVGAAASPSSTTADDDSPDITVRVDKRVDQWGIPGIFDWNGCRRMLLYTFFSSYKVGNGNGNTKQ